MDIFELRSKYQRFNYNSYSISEDNEKIYIDFEFEIEGLKVFKPRTEILKKDFKWKDINANDIKNIVFYLGLVEAISYYKPVCCPTFVIKCGKIDKKQEKWFSDLFYFGLGEFRYVNNIKIDQEEFIRFESQGDFIDISEVSSSNNSGLVVPIGGGKDSVVTISLLKKFKDEILPISIGAKQVVVDCIETAGYERKDLIEINRVIDKGLIELNNEGYFNGHTPFSAIVAFMTYLVATLLGKKYIPLSNEDSANQSNVDGEKINHQYSKTIEFEENFRNFAKEYLREDVEYFSFLRPITEIQIAYLFSKEKEFYKVFKSCNVGSKQTPWVWCCDCPKCMFVYTIMAPFIKRDELIDIFGEDLFAKESLEKTFVELCGYGDLKPFECVGTFEEVRFAVTKTIKQCEEEGRELPYLLKLYKSRYEESKDEFLKYYNNKNFLPEEFDKILRERILEND